MRTDDFVQFIVARHSIFLARQRMQTKPWTENPILQRYRFCNVYRELDTVTQWITQNWREPLSKSGDPNLWFWMLVARLVNHPDTLLRLQTHMRHAKTGEWKWKPDQFISTIESAQFHGRKAWGGAYIVSTNGRQMPKALYIATDVLDPAWKHRKDIQPRQHDTLASFCARLMALNGVQGFIAGQVIADAKYGDEYLAESTDWRTFAVSGPGSKRGLNRVMDDYPNAPWKEERWHHYLVILREETNAALAKLHKKGAADDYPPLHAQDIQNCLCEFDKYERVRLGEGKPRSTYPGV
jgi:hypothetical protein